MAPQDTFIDEEDDTCPLCIEQLDLSDRNFRPCPCGYQICQFCFNNIKTNMNGLCPACRRPYDEKTIQWKVVTTEEVAEFRANIQKNQKKRAAEQRQKEVQKREAEKENRKNLVGVRVVQKNLVYVTGLTPTGSEDELLKTLRKPEFFGQYGNIQKISISNRRSSDGQNQSLGIYVTFERKEDAQRCIAAVNGSQNGDRVLKAQLGTTKYCSAWLRHEQCSNRQCMFLHEQADEDDSYTRQDLSSMNSIHTQRPLSNAAGSSSRTSSRQQTQTPAPSSQTQPSSQAMARAGSKEGSDNGDSSALPSSANWARNPQVRSRRGSHATSGAASSPAVSMSLPATVEAPQEAVEESSQGDSETAQAQPPTEPVQSPSRTSTQAADESMPRRFDDATIEYIKAIGGGSTQLRLVEPFSLSAYPPLFDSRGGEKRRVLGDEDETRVSGVTEALDNQDLSEGEPEQGGSHALGGEPEDRDIGLDSAFDQHRPGTQPPIQRTGNSEGIFGPAIGSNYMPSSTAGSLGGRSMTPQQQQQLFSRPQAAFADHLPPGIGAAQTSLFQGQGQGQAHNRQGSRYSFANDNGAGSSTSVKLAANPRAMAQQSSMMPSSSSFHSQPASQYYATSISGPPPGLKSTGTPPNLFGAQGHAFGGSSAFGSVGVSKESNNDLLQSIMRGRGGQSAAGHDAGKHDDLELDEHVATNIDALVSDEPAELVPPPGNLTGVMGRSGTPSVPPGFGPPITTAQSSPTQLNPTMPMLTASPLSPAPSLSSKKANDEAKKSIRASAVESGLTKDIAAQSSKTSQGKAVLHEEDFPALNAPKPAPAAQPAVPAMQSASKATAPKTTTATNKNKKAGAGETLKVASPALTPALPATQKTMDKKPTPGILNIAAATRAAQTKGADSASATEKSADYPALPTPSSATSFNTTTAARTGPKTLRVVSTPNPRTEVPPPINAATAIAAAAGTSGRSSVLSSHRPGTPHSEFPSDSASVISGSITTSRPNSPPPAGASRIGSAAVRSTTKSQQRKQRKQATKKDAAELISTQTVPEEEVPVIAPILGRKKKQRKERAVASGPSTPTESRAATPGPVAHVDDADAEATQKEVPVKEVEQPVLVKDKGKQGKTSTDGTKNKGKDREDAREVSKAEANAPEKPPKEPIPETAPERGTNEPAEKQAPSPATTLRELESQGLVDTTAIKSLLEPPHSIHHRLERLDAVTTAKEMSTPTKSVVNDEDQVKLLGGEVVHKIVEGVRIMLTPNGDCVRGLSPEEEARFLRLQESLANSAGTPAFFMHPRYEAAGGFSLIKGRAVPNGPPSFFPPAGSAYASDPVAKIQREEAIYYINQFVLPKLNQGAVNSPAGGKANEQSDAGNCQLSNIAPWIQPGEPVSGPGATWTDEPLMSAFDGDVAADGQPQPIPGQPHMTAAAMTTRAFANVPLMSVEEAEKTLQAARRETEKLEKSLYSVIKKNRRLLLGTGGN
ncbi:hypothetical protein MCOR07_007991 [Pyricularia oryzae]|uniref:General negative regulator of transcription subunit 4 n=1 Tax=Pyricularia grisea TaxID=148305 RepID=A0ABQ8NIR3_PYRGI|nr:hypothetical protein MCOR01_010500 [Pyricularia oryzae]KAI6297723.1 hypothetical protein MCOR33_006050 [Pyricularia grisea]KAI6281439.1 hypothetical protein MCOR26_003288 [Pyricularia oryzae]KAI6334867.1 hypothetical protein MCOR29_000610 [Pyricularia oryzae]KAI6341988.1 hypothetical protein MCOR28_005678 [Pyricularia oryzae]